MQKDVQVCKHRNSEEIESLANMRKSQKAAWWTKDCGCGLHPEDTWKERQEPGP